MNSWDNRFLSDYDYGNVIEHAKSMDNNIIIGSDYPDQKWDSRFWSNCDYEHESQDVKSWINPDNKQFKISINKQE